MDYIVNRGVKDGIPAKVVSKSICRVACLWKDAALWGRVIEKCEAKKQLEALSTQELCKTIECFGLHFVLPTFVYPSGILWMQLTIDYRLKAALQGDQRNDTRYTFLQGLVVWNSEH